MDVFSVANKQVAQTAQASVNTSVQAQKPVEQVHMGAKTEETQTISKNNLKNELKATVNNLNDNMKSLDTNVVFGFNDKIDTIFVSVMEKSSGKIIRTIPTEEAMKLSEQMKEVVGMIFDKKG